jgi:hypothetical protein
MTNFWDMNLCSYLPNKRPYLDTHGLVAFETYSEHNMPVTIPMNKPKNPVIRSVVCIIVRTIYNKIFFFIHVLLPIYNLLDLNGSNK